MNTILILLLSLIYVSYIASMPSIGVVVSVRGKKYDINAETVSEVIEQIEKSANLQDGENVVLFRGKVLNSGDNLQEVGVSSGDVLNIVKKRIQRVKSESENDESGLKKFTDADSLKEAASPEDMKKAMEAMDNLLDSNFIDEYFGDDEKLENARLQMLQNMDQYEKTMPGFKAQAEEIASDPQKWREAMQQAKDQIILMKQKRDAMRANKGKQNSVDDVNEDEEE